jgi:hypothetical protein
MTRCTSPWLIHHRFPSRHRPHTCLPSLPQDHAGSPRQPIAAGGPRFLTTSGCSLNQISRATIKPPSSASSAGGTLSPQIAPGLPRLPPWEVCQRGPPRAPASTLRRGPHRKTLTSSGVRAGSARCPLCAAEPLSFLPVQNSSPRSVGILPRSSALSRVDTLGSSAEVFLPAGNCVPEVARPVQGGELGTASMQHVSILFAAAAQPPTGSVLPIRELWEARARPRSIRLNQSSSRGTSAVLLHTSIPRSWLLRRVASGGAVTHGHARGRFPWRCHGQRQKPRAP